VRRGSVADAMLLVTVCLWALNFTTSKYILDHGVRPLAYSGIRYALAALIFLAIVLPRERSLRIERRLRPLGGNFKKKQTKNKQLKHYRRHERV
jgi:drug/metabolite transporter (DMT)-like permease